MNDKIGKISKIEIRGLWNRFDLTWNLQPDVNVLSGINGSGKSTILKCVADVLLFGRLSNNLKELVKSVEVTFDNGKDLKNTFEELHNFIEINIISTFDNEILEVGRRPDLQVRTELDRDIFRLQKKYLEYQLNIGKKAFEVVTQGDNYSQEKVLEIKKQQEKFLAIIDRLFADTDKKINRSKNEITFLRGNDEITAYQLSSGEKQILVILLTVLVQDNKPSIIFMDEPEISLHFDWQKKLIHHVREINPNTQIILATHSPAIIMEGWSDKVVDVKDLITNDRLKPVK